MLTVDQSIEMHPCWIWAESLYHNVEIAAQNCHNCPEIPYRGSVESLRSKQETFIRLLIEKGCESVLESVDCNFKIVTDLATKAQLTGHRFFSLEKPMFYWYDNPDHYCKALVPVGYGPTFNIWLYATKSLKKHLAEDELSRKPQAVPPQSFVIKFFMKVNLRNLRHILRLRNAPSTHPRIRDLFQSLLRIFKTEYPALVFDIPE
jgi:thymidylate synthase ThyX